MYVVYEAFDDNTAVILDLGTFNKQLMYEQQLINFVNAGNQVIGLSVCGKRLNYIQAYNCVSFSTEGEVDEYIIDNNLPKRNKFWAFGYWWILEKKSTEHVVYHICSYAGDTVLYVGNGGYTPYIQAAQNFDKVTAGKKAAIMTQRSKTGKHWTIQRRVV